MILGKVHYSEDYARERLLAALCLLGESLGGRMPIILCIGTDKDLLDCLGPLTGTMLLEMGISPGLVVGHLDQAVTARNIGAAAARLRIQHPDRPVLAVDASASRIEAPGTIILKTGAVAPGKAFNKRLPSVGDYSLTAIVRQSTGSSTDPARLGHVYHMARMISDCLAWWLQALHDSQAAMTEE